MSYLVDALRKAEHERHQGTAPNAAALAGRLTQGGHSGLGLTGWVVVILVACNLLLFGYLFWPSSGTPPRAAGMGKTVAAAEAQQMNTAVVEHDKPAPAAPVNKAPQKVSVKPTPVPKDNSGKQIRQRTSVVARESADNRPAAAIRTQSRPADIPEVEIHGHLYSDNPAESFILVGGRIYHEGERLPDGVVVVKIDRKGALLNYRGRRFHADGPG